MSAILYVIVIIVFAFIAYAVIEEDGKGIYSMKWCVRRQPNYEGMHTPYYKTKDECYRDYLIVNDLTDSKKTRKEFNEFYKTLMIEGFV